MKNKINIILTCFYLALTPNSHAMWSQVHSISQKKDPKINAAIAKLQLDCQDGYLLIEIFSDYGYKYDVIQIRNTSSRINTTTCDIALGVVECDLVDWHLFSSIGKKLASLGDLKPDEINVDPLGFIRIHSFIDGKTYSQYVVSPRDYISMYTNNTAFRRDDPAAGLLLMAIRLDSLGLVSLRRSLVTF